MRQFEYRFRCADVSIADVEKLNAMVKAAKRISFKTFAKHCVWQPFAAECGYKSGADMARDRNTAFYSSVWEGQRCFYIDWSSYECVFLRPADEGDDES